MDAFQSGAAFPDFGYNCFLKSRPEQVDTSNDIDFYLQNIEVKYARLRFLVFILSLVMSFCGG